MEQTVNTFAKGLLMDTHPMVLGSEVLSDALNATFVTMNGNEIVLLNDMGNRRIDNAYLPAGYEPVGIKEHGGIIYVACYNPLTGRGLLGSFPSPERKINTSNEWGELNLVSFLDLISPSNTMYKIIKDNVTIPISGENILHVGDKFSIYSDSLSSILNYIKPIDGRNNLFTFLVGVFNSQNEFVDISDKLKIWDSTNYYINTVSGVDTNSNTIDDETLFKERNSLAINTYSEKMSSPLYLKAVLNHVSNISYEISGDYSDDGSTPLANLKVKVTYTYNCPSVINDEYFKLIFETNSSQTTISPLASDVSSEEWDEESEGYKRTITYKINDINVSGSELEYTLKFPLLTNYPEYVSLNKPIIQDNLTKTGKLDLSLLGTGKAFFSGYRYFYEEDRTILDLDIKSYPKETSEYYITPVIVDNNGTIKKKLETLNTPNSGIYSMIFNNDELETRKLYKIQLIRTELDITSISEENMSNISYSIVSLDNTTLSVQNKNTLYITTSIFNGNYIGNDTITSTFTDGEYSYEDHSNLYIENFQNIYKLKIKPILSHTYTLSIADERVKINGNLLYKDSDSGDKNYLYITKYNNINNIKFKASVNNIELYPDSVDTILSISNLEGISDTNNSQKTYREINGERVDINNNKYTYSDDSLFEVRGNQVSMDNPIEITEIFSTFDSNNNSLYLTSYISIKNEAKGPIVYKPIPCLHVITSLYRFLKNMIYTPDESLYLVNNPYINVDSESTSGFSFSYIKEKLKDLTPDNPTVTYLGSYGSDILSKVSALICGITDNFLVWEYNSNDVIFGYELPIILEQASTNTYKIKNGYKRLWMRVSKNEYTPIFIISKRDDRLENAFNDDGFINVLKHIPHYYAYSSEERTLNNKKIIDSSTLTKTSDFNISSKLYVGIKATIQLTGLNTPFMLYETNLDSDNKITIFNNIEIIENNLKSSDIFQEKIESLNNFSFNCILIADTSNGGEEIITADAEGNDFDPLYVYYNLDLDSSELLFKQSYKADRYYIEEYQTNMPELKDSSQLYHDKYGNNHKLVNPVASPLTLPSRQYSIDVDYSGWLSINTSILENLTISHSGLLFEDKSYAAYFPINIRNIFDYKTIITYKYIKQSVSSWQTADSYNPTH